MFNKDVFTSPDKCISECDKQIEFSKNLINYLEQYIIQLEAIKTMAGSAKAFQDANPYSNFMHQFMEYFNKNTKDTE